MREVAGAASDRSIGIHFALLVEKRQEGWRIRGSRVVHFGRGMRGNGGRGDRATRAVTGQTVSVGRTRRLQDFGRRRQVPRP